MVHVRVDLPEIPAMPICGTARLLGLVLGDKSFVRPGCFTRSPQSVFHGRPLFICVSRRR